MDWIFAVEAFCVLLQIGSVLLSVKMERWVIRRRIGQIFDAVDDLTASVLVGRQQEGRG